MEADTRRRLTLHRSLNRSALLLGCDRELLLLSGVLSATMIFAVLTKVAIVFGIVFWLVMLAFLSRLAKVDPLMRLVYLKHIRYPDFMPAQARYCGKVPTVPTSWKE